MKKPVVPTNAGSLFQRSMARTGNITVTYLFAVEKVSHLFRVYSHSIATLV